MDNIFYVIDTFMFDCVEYERCALEHPRGAVLTRVKEADCKKQSEADWIPPSHLACHRTH